MDLKQAFQILQLDVGSSYQMAEAAYFEFLLVLQTGQEFYDIQGNVITEEVLTEAIQTIRNSTLRVSASSINQETLIANSTPSFIDEPIVLHPKTSLTLRTTTNSSTIPVDFDRSNPIFQSSINKEDTMEIRSSVGLHQKVTSPKNLSAIDVEKVPNVEGESDLISFRSTINYKSEKIIRVETAPSSPNERKELNLKNVRKIRRGNVSLIRTSKKEGNQKNIEEPAKSPETKVKRTDGIVVQPSEFDHTVPLDRSGRRKAMLTTRHHDDVSKDSIPNEPLLQESKTIPTQSLNSFKINADSSTKPLNTTIQVENSFKQRRTTTTYLLVILFILILSSTLLYFYPYSLGK